MAVSLSKDPSFLRYAGARTPEFGSSYDLLEWERVTAPLWHDDASYIAYQASDGPTGYGYVEFGFLPGEPVLVHRWVTFGDFDWKATTDSRAVRALHARFITQLRELDAMGAEDRITAGWGTDDIPF